MADNRFIVKHLCEHIEKLQQNNSYLIECIRLLKQQQNHVALLLNKPSWKELQMSIYNNQYELRIKHTQKQQHYMTPSKNNNAYFRHLGTPYESPIRQQSGIRKNVIRGNTQREFQQNKTIYTEIQNIDDAFSMKSKINGIQNEARLQQIIKQIKWGRSSKDLQNRTYQLKSRTIGQSTLSCFVTAENRQRSELKSFQYEQQTPTSKLQQQNVMLAIQNTKLRQRIQQLQQNNQYI